MTILVFDTERRMNAELILDCVELDYLRTTDRILDPTYGLGNWWKLWLPWEGRVHRHDLDPSKAPDGPMDFTALAYPDETFDVVAYDPPYKLNGTPTKEVDAPYGVHVPATVKERLRLMFDGLDEAIRVCRAGGYVLAKCQDQVVSGRKCWQRYMVAQHAIGRGCRLVDELHVSSYRPQPAGRRQVHAASNFSTLQIFRRNP